MTETFSAQLDSWVAETRERAEAVLRQSVQEVFADMQTPVAAGGNMPVDTGFLRASARVTLGEPLPMGEENPGGRHSFDGASGVAAISSMRLGDTLYVSYTASYAAHVHYGANGRPGRQWITLAAQKWPETVAQVSARLRSGVES